MHIHGYNNSQVNKYTCTCIIHVPESPHSWNDALTFGLAFLRKLTKLWHITGCINLYKSCLLQKYKSKWNCMIYWKVSACESGKSCLTTDFTRFCTWRNFYFFHEHLWFYCFMLSTSWCLWKPKDIYALHLQWFLQEITDPQNGHIPYRRSEQRINSLVFTLSVVENYWEN